MRTAPIGLGLLVLVGLSGGYAATEVGLGGDFGLPLDDGWIHAAYARNLARGQGFSLAGSAEWIPGSTAPLWTWLVSGLFLIAGPSLWPLKALGLLSAVAAVLAMRRLVQVATGDARAADLSALVLAATPRFVWGAVSGMEVPLYVALVLAGLAHHLDRRDAPLSRWWPAPLLLALSGWARPECFALPFVAALHRRRLTDVAAAALLVAPYPLYHLALYGHPLPTTFYAKAADHTPLAVLGSSGALAAAGALAANVSRELAAFWAWLPTHLPLVVLGLWPAVVHGRRARNGVPFVLAALVAFVVARGALGYAGPWAQYGRYFAHAWPLLLVAGCHGLCLAPPRPWLVWSTLALTALACVAWPRYAPLFLFDHGGADLGVMALETWFIVLPGLAWLVLAALAAVGARGPSAAGAGFPRDASAIAVATVAILHLGAANALGALHHGRNVRDTNAYHVAMAHRVRELVPPGAVLACHDIGALGFFTECRLLDLAGIGSPEILFRPRGPGGMPDAAGLLAERRPVWFCALDGWLGRLFPGGTRPAGLVDYAPVATIARSDNVTVGGSTYHLVRLKWQ